MALEIGQRAPDFSLYDSEKNKVHLADLKGDPVLLLFLPRKLYTCIEKPFSKPLLKSKVTKEVAGLG